MAAARARVPSHFLGGKISHGSHGFPSQNLEVEPPEVGDGLRKWRKLDGDLTATDLGPQCSLVESLGMHRMNDFLWMNDIRVYIYIYT